MPELETAVAAAEPAAAKKATKKRAVVYGVFSVLLVLGVLAGIAAAILQTRNTNKLLKTAMRQNESMQAALEAALKQSDESGEDLEEAEDDVVIMDEYTIRSTTQISDAYLSGDTSALSDRDKETLEMAKDVLDSVITDDMSDYDKEKAIYTWLTTKLTANTGLLTVIPNTDDGADNPYGVLKNRNPVCVGYATTFRLFMQMLGIECKVVHNLDRYHSWDLRLVPRGLLHGLRLRQHGKLQHGRQRRRQRPRLEHLVLPRRTRHPLFPRDDEPQNRRRPLRTASLNPRRA